MVCGIVTLMGDYSQFLRVLLLLVLRVTYGKTRLLGGKHSLLM